MTKKRLFTEFIIGAGAIGLALLSRHNPFILYEYIAKSKNIPLWTTPEMNLQSYYSPVKEKPIPVYADGEVVALVKFEGDG